MAKPSHGICYTGIKHSSCHDIDSPYGDHGRIGKSRKNFIWANQSGQREGNQDNQRDQVDAKFVRPKKDQRANDYCQGKSDVRGQVGFPIII